MIASFRSDSSWWTPWTFLCLLSQQLIKWDNCYYRPQGLAHTLIQPVAHVKPYFTWVDSLSPFLQFHSSPCITLPIRGRGALHLTFAKLLVHLIDCQHLYITVIVVLVTFPWFQGRNGTVEGHSNGNVQSMKARKLRNKGEAKHNSTSFQVMPPGIHIQPDPTSSQDRQPLNWSAENPLMSATLPQFSYLPNMWDFGGNVLDLNHNGDLLEFSSSALYRELVP